MNQERFVLNTHCSYYLVLGTNMPEDMETNIPTGAKTDWKMILNMCLAGDLLHLWEM